MSRLALLLLLVGLISDRASAADRPPNVVILFVDDMGYGDLSCYGAKGYTTPNLDRMASEGMKFTDFYVGQAVCSASRAALLTGCYPVRVSILGALSPESKTGISDKEILLPQILKKRGYATALYGKWHLGDSPQFLPTRHGFDEYFGLPYSNDMLGRPDRPNYPKLPLVENEKVLQRNPDQTQLVTWYTEHAVSFIQKHKDGPFFLEVAHNMPHVPLHVSSKFAGKSQRGLYGDVLEEIDWSVGQILDTIKRCGIDGETLVVLFSDNGPFLSYGNHAGSAKPLREGKLTSFEGGVRSPFIARWPGRVPAAKVCDEPVMEIDLLPTIAGLTGGKLSERKIDGKDILALLEGKPGAKSPHEALVFYSGDELQAVRSGEWKLHFPHPYITVDGEPGRDGKPARFGQMKPKAITQSGVAGIASRHGYRVENIGLSLFNLKDDPGETRDVAQEHPEMVEHLKKLAEPMRKELGDALLRVKGTENRPLGLAP